jgi:NAD(P)-dependent dehydrogenase (short-subunit alcohol dehydrogenase family)
LGDALLTAMVRKSLGLGLLGAAALGLRAAVRRNRTLDVRGRVVAITGGSRGLGLVLARELVDRGARVAICARDGIELERAKADLVSRGGEVHAGICDVSDRDDVLAFVAAIEDELGPIDVLINNAGVIDVGPLELMNADDFERSLATNLRGPLNAALAVLPLMRKRQRGRIVNIASIGGKVAVPHLATYTTSKFALVGLSEALRVESAKDGIYVTTVCPGLMVTGSPRHARFKGDRDTEYTWFSIADSSRLSAVSAQSAAKQIIAAFEAGQAELVIGPQAKLMAFMHGLAPNLVANVMGVVARLLPRGEPSARASAPGSDLSIIVSPEWVRRSDEAAAENNELPPRL